MGRQVGLEKKGLAPQPPHGLGSAPSEGLLGVLFGGDPWGRVAGMAVALAGWRVLGKAEFGVPGSTAGEEPQAREWEPSCGCG